MRHTYPRIPTLLALALAASALAPQTAGAHFVLGSPASWRVQNALGNPQKLGPCGDEGTAATTGAVTAFLPGETITITIDEVIYHPGHYRVALAVNDRSELPVEPPVTPGATACGSVPIMSSPVFPVLADGALQHAAPFSGPQVIEVALPSDVTCTNCTLQVLEFMSDHAAPCFYHHCADISIAASSEGCEIDADCADDNACTSDHCNLTTSTCENVDTSASCNDGEACTQDACDGTEGCVAQPITLADVDADFLGLPQAVQCSTEPVPAVIGTRFGAATSLVTRAAEDPSKARRFLTRASRKLRKVAKKITKAQGHSISTECGSALGAILGETQTRLDCLRVGD